MKPHTPDQVAAMKSFADSQPTGAERKTYALNGLEVTYTTVDMGESKPFDYAVAAFVAPREDGEPITEADYEIAVSDDVPEELQGIWAWHELNDFAVLGHEAENRCLRSEQVLADSMSSDQDLYQQYLTVRISFYDSLAVFIATDLDQKGDDSMYSPADLKGCHDATVFLQTQKRPLRKIKFQLKLSTYVDSALAARHLEEAEEAERVRLATEHAAEQAHFNEEMLQVERQEARERISAFIEIMRGYNIPTEQLWEGSWAATSRIGWGWQIRSFIPGHTSKGADFGDDYEGQMGIMLLTDGTSRNFVRVGENKTPASFPIPETGLPDDYYLFLGDDGLKLLGDAIVYYRLRTLPKGNVDKPITEQQALAKKPKTQKPPETEPSPTAWIGRPHTR